MNAKLAASCCRVKDVRPICLLIMKPNYLGWDQKSLAMVLCDLPDCWDHGTKFTEDKWECEWSWSQMKGTLSKKRHVLDGGRALQELELDPALGCCFCTCASGALLHSLPWNWNQFTSAKMLVSVSVTRRKVYPWGLGKGPWAQTSAFCLSSPCNNRDINSDVTRCIWPKFSDVTVRFI